MINRLMESPYALALEPIPEAIGHHLASEDSKVKVV
jgi:hypothetical protein